MERRKVETRERETCGKVALRPTRFDGRWEGYPLECQCWKGHNGDCQHIAVSPSGYTRIYEWKQGDLEARRHH